MGPTPETKAKLAPDQLSCLLALIRRVADDNQSVAEIAAQFELREEAVTEAKKDGIGSYNA